MTRYQKRKIDELLSTLKEAHIELKNQNSSQIVLQLLCDCQEFVIQIGNYIEQIEGKGTNTVTLLEEYCELLYIMSVEVEAHTHINKASENIYKIESKLDEIQKCISKELVPNKIEVVFFPYKYAMADCMESIWLQALQDESCEVYICPIPYFERASNGGIKAVHYEGKEFTGNLPIVHWEEYDVKERRPDVIFVHNPYDENNYITSVDPEFYCKTLKKYTDMLVYIPYFVSVDDIEEHFCVNAGTLWADKVFVQSEKIRETYISKIKKFANENKCMEILGNIDEKFIVKGSPKFDKVINTIRDNIEIPKSWQDLIYTVDNMRKKVIFYNTTLGAILLNGEDYLKKLHDTLDIFKNRQDIVLLWRPHPLSDMTYQSMKPELFAEYNKITTEYRKQGWGIYDDSADLHRAIAISDAYYGDFSSIVSLFGIAGKNIMIQNIHQTGVENHAIAFENLYDDGEQFWFTPWNINALYKMDKKSWNIEYMGSFPNEKMDGTRLYGDITYQKGKLFFSPMAAKEIGGYDIEEQKFFKINYEHLQVKSVDGYSEYSYYSSISWKKYVFFFPLYKTSILRYDLESGELNEYSNWFNELKSRGDIQEGRIIYSIEIVEDKVYAPIAGQNTVMCFDMNTCKINFYTVGKKGNCYSGICFDGKDFWLCPLRGEAIIKWNIHNNSFIEVKFNATSKKDEDAYWRILHIQDKIVTFPVKESNVLEIDINTNTVNIINELSIPCIQENIANYIDTNYILATVDNENIYAHTGKTNIFIKYNLKTKEIRKEPILLEDKLRKRLFEQLMIEKVKNAQCERDFMFIETPTLNLVTYLNIQYDDLLKPTLQDFCEEQKRFFKQNNCCLNESSGSSIYSYVRNIVLH